MSRLQGPLALSLLLCLAVTSATAAARTGRTGREPHVGYVCPAGGRVGSTLDVTVGGQYLDPVAEVLIAGTGIHATVIKHNKPMTQKRVNQLREKLQQARKKLQAEGKTVRLFGGRGKRGNLVALIRVAKQMGVPEKDVRAFIEYQRRRADPKRQLNPQIAETVTLKVTIDRNAALGPHPFRLKTPTKLSNPLGFWVGQWPEYREAPTDTRSAVTSVEGPLPVVLNGQILPGQTDRFRFPARRGDRLVIATQARQLMPYLADAVPGWFQATLALHDDTGRELAYDDDFQFHPDPVLYYKIPADGLYDLEIKDAIYRGREDFVYRITLGEVPFVTSIFPLGGRRGELTQIAVTGWNLPVDRVRVDTKRWQPGIHWISVVHGKRRANRVPFAVDTLPDCSEQEPNNRRATAQRIDLPMIVNGRINQPGDWDVFQFEGQAGSPVVLEVTARRLNSPVDSLLRVTDASGRELAANDDHEDPAAGLVTHQADSKIRLTLPATGTYYARLGDTQNHGGPTYGYRLRISAPRPDFQLRVVPSTINTRAGATLPITVHALRRDGFDGDIFLALKDPPAGFLLAGGCVPRGRNRIRVTLTVPATSAAQSVRLQLAGTAMINGRKVRHAAVPADDMLQAFIYHHLVAAGDWRIAVAGRPGAARPQPASGKRRFRTRTGNRGRRRAAARPPRFESHPLRIPLGDTARIELPRGKNPRGGKIQFELDDPPPGITIEKMPSSQEPAAILVRADARKIKPDTAGNLIVRVFVERTFQRGGGKKPVTRRVPVRTLPAIRFRVVTGAG